MKRKEIRLLIGIIGFAGILISCNKEVPTPDPPGDNIIRDPTTQMEVINDVLGGVPIVVAESSTNDLMVAFKRTLDGEVLTFSPLRHSLPAAFSDQNGTTWDIFGYAMSGKDAGKRLEPAHSMTGFWFSFATFYPGLTIHPKLDPGPNENQKVVGNDLWTIPPDEVVDGGPGKDGIPAIEDPVFIEARSADFLELDDLVVGFFDGVEYKVYPHKILNWHEIVNEETDLLDYSIIYCPLTGTASCWSGILNNKSTSFGVSGLLYNSNIIPYDRETDSYWSQIKGEAVSGPLKGTQPERLAVVETSWGKWLDMYPSSKVLSTNTGYNRDYDVYPYGSYNHIDSDYLIFRVKFDDNRLPKKQRVLAVMQDSIARVYQFDQ